MKYSFKHKDALWALISQAILIFSLSPIVWYFWHLREAMSLLVGGFVCLAPNIYLYRRVFAFYGAHASQQIVKALYWGEAVKIILTALFFIGALLIPWGLPLWIFIGYLLAQIGFWLGPIYLSLKKN